MHEDSEIESWKAKATYFRSTKAGGMNVFVQDVGYFGQIGSPQTWVQTILPFYEKLDS